MECIRDLLREHAALSAPADTIADDANLYDLGLESLGAVNLMLALERRFDIEFSDAFLTRDTFASITAIRNAVAALRQRAATA